MNNEMYTRDDFDTEEEYDEYIGFDPDPPIDEYDEYIGAENGIGCEIMTFPVALVREQVIPAMEKAKAALTGDVVEELSKAILWLEYSAKERSFIQ